MTANSDQFVGFIVEKLESVEAFASGRFFGGIGLVSDSVQFGMLMGNSVFFVVDAQTRQKYEQAGSECFSYNTSKKLVLVRKYYEVPSNVIEDADEFLNWAAESIRVAKQLKNAK